MTACCLSLLVEILVTNRSPGMGWPLLVLVSWVATRWMLRQCERRPSWWTQILWLIPAALSASLATYDAEVVRTVAPAGTMLGLLGCVYWSFLGTESSDAFACTLRFPRPELPFQVASEASLGLRGLRACADPERGQTYRKVAQGLLLSLPFLAIFTVLFSSDPVFSDRLLHSLDLLSGDLVFPVVRVALAAFFLLGFFRALLLRRRPIQAPADDATQFDAVMLSTSMVMLNLLFASFLTIQGRYLFAGQALIALPGMTYAQYARAGFWELVTATALVLAISGLVYRSSARSRAGRAPLLLNAVLILQTYGVAASAAKRLLMLVDAYGLTLVRLYGAAGILLMSSLLGLVLVSVAMGWSWPRLEARMAIAGLTLASSMLLFNAEGWVAHVNLQRSEVDYDYLAGLSADVVPALRYEAIAGDAPVRQRAASAMATVVAARPGCEEWRSWNWSRARAQCRLQPESRG